MLTRSKTGHSRPKYWVDLVCLSPCCLHFVLMVSYASKGFKTTAKDSRWMAAMIDKLDALHKNNTWDLVPYPSSSNFIGSKWIFLH